MLALKLKLMCHLTNGFVLQYTHYKENNTM